MLTRVLSLIFSLLLSQCVYLKMPPVNMYVGILVSMLGVSSSNSSNSSDLFVIYGTITGLEGFGLVLKNNEEYLYPSANGSFQFAIPLKSGTNYTISVATPPTNPSQTCTVTNGSGVITQNISNVQISCVKNSYTIGGVIVGLSGSGLVLQNNNESITMNSTDTSFVFSKPMVSGGTYSVSIISQPANQTCSVTNDYGTVTSANILGVVVNCTSNSHIVSGTVKGLISSGLVLQLNSANDLSVTGSSFAFPTALLSGSTYTVSILTQPSNPPQNCSLQNQTGTISGADVSNVTITCVTNSVNISGIPNGGLNLTEGSGSAVLSFGLKSSPTSDVIVSFYCGNQIEPLKSLTFTASNWNIPQSVNVSAVDDSIAEGLHSGAIIIYTSSNDVYYNGLVIPSINASITDNDSASVAVSTGNIFLTEGSTPQSYTVKLSSQPSGDVRIQMNPGSQVSIVPSTLTFTSTNWNTLQTVTVSAVDDSIVEGNHVGAISFTMFSSIDVDYHNITVPNLNVNITDNDVAGILLSTTSVSLVEGESSASYSIKLTSLPTSSVTVNLTTSSQVTTTATSLSFNATNWNVAQTVTINAVDDFILEGNHSGIISHSSSSADSNYNSASYPSVTVNITDNDVASVVANIVSALSVAEGTASNATYTVRLSSQPSSNVIVTLSSGTQLTVNPSTLTFTNSSWNTGQTITVNAVDDSIDEGTPHLGTISYSVASVDTNYNGILVANTSVSITDNDNVPPSNLVYSGSPYTFLQNTAMSIVPTYTGIVTTCSCTPAIPSGMSLSSNCAISGTPTQSFSATSYIITAGNIHGTTPSATVSISIAVTDTVAPTVVSTVPSDTATLVSPSPGEITVTFSESMNTSLLTHTLTTEAWDGTTYNAIPNTGTTFSWTNSTTLKISMSWILFPENTKIRWTLDNTNLKDLASNMLAASIQQTFTTTTRNVQFPVADTGQTKCYDNTTEIPCGDANFPGQDGDYVDTPVARNFTGPYTESGYPNDYITKDNVTGLVWKTCIEGLSGASCTGTYTSLSSWYEGINACSGLNTANGGNGFAGKKNWRLPNIKETRVLPNYGSFPTIDTIPFPTSITPQIRSSTSAQFAFGYGDYFRYNVYLNLPVDFSFLGLAPKSGGILPVRCVSDTVTPSQLSYTDNNNGTIKDNVTNLIWQKCSMGQNNDSTCSGSDSVVNWQTALSYCKKLSLAGRIWRLPSINELKSIVDFSKHAPALDSTYFPNTNGTMRWSSTTNYENPTIAWRINSCCGAEVTYDANKVTNFNATRCVSSYSTTTDILEFKIPSASATGNIVGTNITVIVPSTTDVTALVPTFKHNGGYVKVGATYQYSGTTANDFTSPVTYTVYADDGTSKSYTVTVVKAATLGTLRTGQVNCYDAAGTLISCTGTGQDGELRKTTARSYTNNNDGTVTDNATGLIWQRCSMGLSNDASCTDDGNTGNDVATWTDAVSYCNGLALASKTWRLPHVKELSTLVDAGVYNPSIDSSVFPNTNSPYWTSTVYKNDVSKAWGGDFYGGLFMYYIKTTAYKVRCVSGQPYTEPTYTDNGNGTVTDSQTGLVWQKCSKGSYTDTNNCTGGSASTATWVNALSYCNGLTLGGKDDWRLPNRNELQSLVDYNAYNPSINNIFQNTVASPFFSSTVAAPPDTMYSWFLNFNNGFRSVALLTNSLYVRCVRGQ